MTRILIASTPAYGHFAPLLSIAAHVVASGYEVHFLTGERFRSAVEETGATFIALTGKANYDTSRPRDFFPERGGLPAGFPRLEYDMRHIFADPVPDQHAAITRILDEADEQVIIVQDAWFFGT